MPHHFDDYSTRELLQMAEDGEILPGHSHRILELLTLNADPTQPDQNGLNSFDHFQANRDYNAIYTILDSINPDSSESDFDSDYDDDMYDEDYDDDYKFDRTTSFNHDSYTQDEFQKIVDNLLIRVFRKQTKEEKLRKSDSNSNVIDTVYVKNLITQYGANPNGNKTGRPLINAMKRSPLYYFDIIDTFSKKDLNINLPDQDGNTAAHGVQKYCYLPGGFLDHHEVIYTDLIHRGADLTLRNKANEYPLYFYKFQIEPDDDIAESLHKNIYAKKGWTIDDVLSKLESATYAEVLGLDIDMNQKDPHSYLRQYRDLRHQNDQDISIVNTANHIHDFLNMGAKQILLPALLDRYPDYPYEDKKSKNGEVDPVLLRSLRRSFAQTLFGPNHESNVPMVQIPNILKILDRWDYNRAAIRNAIKDPDNADIKVDFPTLTQAIKAPNGMWIVPITSSDTLQSEGDTLRHCVEDYLPDCMSGLQIVGIRRDKDVPESTASYKTNYNEDKHFIEDSKPLGYRNVSYKQDDPVSEAWGWYLDNLNAGTWGNPKDKIEFLDNQTDALSQQYDMLTITIGYNPRDKQTSHTHVSKAWDTWTKALDNKIRHSKLSLDQMLDQSGLTQTFDDMAEKAGIRGPSGPAPLKGPTP
jgi:hypothetical protein